MTLDFKNNLFNLSSDAVFIKTALQLFKWQAKEVEVYGKYLELLKVNTENIKDLKDIPFLPISFFKSHKVTSASVQNATTFTSSGTTGQVSSKHFVPDIDLYKTSFTKGFNLFYGHPKDYCILALLPAYLERKGSSLIYMVDHLIKASSHSLSGFHLKDHAALRKKLHQLKAENKKTLLIGVSFGLLDFIEDKKFNWPALTVMETGGMKGRRKEIIRSELHSLLKDGFNVTNIHSEYGMTELLSQAYSNQSGIYHCPPWMKVWARDTADPFSTVNYGQSGGLNIIDLANIYSCAFIATEDLARVYADGSFEVLGRFDEAEVRGCNLMV